MVDQGHIPYMGTGLVDLGKASVEATKLYFEDVDRIWPLSTMLIANLKASFPELTNDYLTKHGNLQLFNHMVAMGVFINDCFDLSRYAEFGNNPSLVEKAYNKWQSLRQAAFNTIERFETSSENKDALHKRLVLYEQETILIESEALKIANWDFASIKLYRETTNAIALVNLSAVLLGGEENEADNFTEDTTYQQIIEKYSWIMNREPLSERQRKLAGLFNATMAVQVVDDINDKQIDLKLELPTFATQTEVDVQEILAGYIAQAKKYGIKHRVLSAQIGVFRFMKSIMNAFPQWAGQRERLFS